MSVFWGHLKGFLFRHSFPRLCCKFCSTFAVTVVIFGLLNRFYYLLKGGFVASIITKIMWLTNIWITDAQKLRFQPPSPSQASRWLSRQHHAVHCSHATNVATSTSGSSAVELSTSCDCDIGRPSTSREDTRQWRTWWDVRQLGHHWHDLVTNMQTLYILHCVSE